MAPSSPKKSRLPREPNGGHTRSKRADRAAQDNHRDEGDERADDRHHDDVEVAFTMSRAQTESSVTTAPLCGRLSRVPAPITATRCSKSGLIPCSAASFI